MFLNFRRFLDRPAISEGFSFNVMTSLKFSFRVLEIEKENSMGNVESLWMRINCHVWPQILAKSPQKIEEKSFKIPDST